MSTQEDRMTALEQRVTAIELERLYERKRATESASSEQAYDVKQVNYHMTMLLGIATGQEHAITSIKNDVSSIRVQVTNVSAQLTDVRTQITDVRQDMSSMREQIADVRQDMSGQITGVRQDMSSMREQIADVKQDVSGLNLKFDRLEKLITDRFSPS